MIYAVRIAFWKAWNNILIKVCVLPFRFLTADLVQNIQKYEMYVLRITDNVHSSDRSEIDVQVLRSCCR
jgi:hypothetical protein